MKTTRITLAVTTALGLGLAAGSAVGGIADTKHNLGYSNGSNTNYVTDDGTPGLLNNEICVFCHTPHGADTTVSAPLWNKTKSTASYTMYDSPTMDQAEPGAPGGVSVACLSCHDGTQAMDVIINAPGSGNYSTGATAYRGFTWSMYGATDSTGKMPVNGAGGFANVANLGTNLQNDHPISIKYAAGVNSGTYDAPAIYNDPDFNSNDYDAVTGRYWVDSLFFTPSGVSGSYDLTSNGDGTFSKNDMVLYGTDNTNQKVECASCHDPHTTTVTFLRTPNDGSAVCLSCHDK